MEHNKSKCVSCGKPFVRKNTNRCNKCLDKELDAYTTNILTLRQLEIHVLEDEVYPFLNTIYKRDYDKINQFIEHHIGNINPADNINKYSKLIDRLFTNVHGLKKIYSEFKKNNRGSGKKYTFDISLKPMGLIIKDGNVKKTIKLSEFKKTTKGGSISCQSKLPPELYQILSGGSIAGSSRLPPEQYRVLSGGSIAGSSRLPTEQYRVLSGGSIAGSSRLPPEQYRVLSGGSIAGSSRLPPEQYRVLSGGSIAGSSRLPPEQYRVLSGGSIAGSSRLPTEQYRIIA